MSITNRNGLPIDDATGAVAVTGGVGSSAASAVTFSPTGSVAATNVQAAIAEVASEYAAADTTEATARATGDTTVPINTQTASYTLVLGDAGKCVEENSASATVITIPPNSSVPFPIGTIISLRRVGAGTVTITDGAGVTMPNRLESAGTTSRTLPSVWSEASIHKRGTDQWVLSGDFA